MKLIDWKPLEDIIRRAYFTKGLSAEFKQDYKYLKDSFYDIEAIWMQQLNCIEVIEHLLFSEAPLWGSNKKYIYNPKTPHSQFFFHKDLAEPLGITIKNKTELINKLNEIGFLILDISPYALNEEDTSLNFQRMSSGFYKDLISKTVPFYLEKKLDLIAHKLAHHPKMYFRYPRVSDAFKDQVLEALIVKNLTTSHTNIECIMQDGGGIDRDILKKYFKS